MTEQAQRIAIAEACPTAIKREGDFWYYKSSLSGLWTPCANNDPLHDLNACHEMEKVILPENRQSYSWALAEVVGTDDMLWPFIHATAAQRAEAFLRTLGLWKD